MESVAVLTFQYLRVLILMLPSLHRSIRDSRQLAPPNYEVTSPQPSPLQKEMLSGHSQSSHVKTVPSPIHAWRPKLILLYSKVKKRALHLHYGVELRTSSYLLPAKDYLKRFQCGLQKLQAQREAWYAEARRQFQLFCRSFPRLRRTPAPPTFLSTALRSS